MLIDSKHSRWMLLSLVILGVCLFFYVPYNKAGMEQPSGGTLQGIVYGVVGFILMVVAGALGARKRVRIWRLGRAREWVRAHIWLGLISFPVILFHSGFRLGGGILTGTLMILFIVVIVSGVIGLAIQHVVPRLMLLQVPRETIFEQIPHVIDQIRLEADRMVQAVCGDLGVPQEAVLEPAGPSMTRILGRARVVKAIDDSPRGSEMLKRFYLEEVRPFLAPAVGEHQAFYSLAAGSARFTNIRMLLPGSLQGTLEDIRALCDERRELARQERLHHWLHGWLLIHIPLAYALLLLGVVHAVVSVFF